MARRPRIRNKTGYDTPEVARLVRGVLKDMEIDMIEVRVGYSRSGGTTGRYREFWYPSEGEDRPVIICCLPKPGLEILPWQPYTRQQAPPVFVLEDWREALVAIVAHEAMHARQTPRNGFASSKKIIGGKRRYVEHECDWAAFRAVRRYRGSDPITILIAVAT